MIKVGFIGAGGVANIHRSGLMGIEGVEAAALTRKNLDTARQRARELRIPNVYKNYRQILEDPGIDVVHCLLPNYLHYDVMTEALEAGKHVMGEKPLTMTLEEAEKLTGLAKRSGLLHAVNFRYRYFPLIREIRSKCLAGDLGDIRLVHGVFLQDWLSTGRDYNWRLDREISGPLATMADIGSHWFDIIEYILNQRISRVSARLATMIPERIRGNRESVRVESEDTAVVQFEMESGAVGSAMLSQVATGRRMGHLRFEINGSKQSVAWNKELPDKLWLGYRDNHNYSMYYQPQDASSPLNSEIRTLMENFYGAVKAHKKGEKDFTGFDYPTFEDGLHSMKVLEAVLNSHRKTCWVNVDPGS
jgi:predicted dehydrogenase